MAKMNYLYQELKKKGVTLQLLWYEYKQDNPEGYQYSQFCELYRRWVKLLDVTLRQKHKAGESLGRFFGRKAEKGGRYMGKSDDALQEEINIYLKLLKIAYREKNFKKARTLADLLHHVLEVWAAEEKIPHVHRNGNVFSKRGVSLALHQGGKNPAVSTQLDV